MTMKTYQILSRAIGAKARCDKEPGNPWSQRWQERIDQLLGDFPSGSGYDRGTKLDDSSVPERLVFNTSFHHMDDGGMYDGWTDHQVIITPSLEMGWHMRITGRDRNGIKEMIGEDFAYQLDKDAPEFEPAKQEQTQQA